MSAKPNYFVRIFIGLLSLLLAAMVVYRYLWVTPKGDISAGIITLICLLIVLVLAESFDSFSVGKILSIKREVEKKEKEVEKLEGRNDKLLTQLISISSNQNQNQNQASTNVFAFPPNVSKATGKEIEEDKKTSEAVIATIEEAAGPVHVTPTEETETERQVLPVAEDRSERLRLLWSKVEDIAFEKYFGAVGMQTLSIIREVKLTEREQMFDPISTMPIIFDAYFDSKVSETFVEFKLSRVSFSFRDRLYVMLSKINHYRVTKRVNATLDLVIVKVPGEPDRFGGVERVLHDFSPAISSGLLNLRYVELTEEEAASCRVPWNINATALG